MPTFGFEAEFGSNVNELVSYLYGQPGRLIGDSSMHGYHCDCAACNFDGPYPLRAQTDSSCGGEVISSPFGNLSQAQEVCEALEYAAVAVDSEPGFTAGFHVHVGIPHSWGAQRKGQLVWAFALWEPVLLYISSGRFSENRGFNSRVAYSVVPAVYERLTGSSYWDVPGLSDARQCRRAVEDILASVKEEGAPLPYSAMYENHWDVDRHSNLNVNTNYGTFEYRLWNSTRSAWRMLLWCGLSLALANPPFARTLIDVEEPPALNVVGSARRLVELLNDSGRNDTAERLTTQLDYLDTVDREGAPELFAVA